jgi:hypothetical protein
MRKATRIIAASFGFVAGFGGLEHGYFEILQGNARPDSIMIASMGAPCVPEEIWNACEPANDHNSQLPGHWHPGNGAWTCHDRVGTGFCAAKAGRRDPRLAVVRTAADWRRHLPTSHWNYRRSARNQDQYAVEEAAQFRLEDAGKDVAMGVSCFLHMAIWAIPGRLLVQRVPDGERGAHSPLDPWAAGGFYSGGIRARCPTERARRRLTG